MIEIPLFRSRSQAPQRHHQAADSAEGLGINPTIAGVGGSTAHCSFDPSSKQVVKVPLAHGRPRWKMPITLQNPEFPITFCGPEFAYRYQPRAHISDLGLSRQNALKIRNRVGFLRTKILLPQGETFPGAKTE
jgi:hypothetical protein